MKVSAAQVIDLPLGAPPGRAEPDLRCGALGLRPHLGSCERDGPTNWLGGAVDDDNGGSGGGEPSLPQGGPHLREHPGATLFGRTRVG